MIVWLSKIFLDMYNFRKCTHGTCNLIEVKVRKTSKINLNYQNNILKNTWIETKKNIQ